LKKGEGRVAIVPSTNARLFRAFCAGLFDSSGRDAIREDHFRQISLRSLFTIKMMRARRTLEETKKRGGGRGESVGRPGKARICGELYLACFPSPRGIANSRAQINALDYLERWIFPLALNVPVSREPGNFYLAPPCRQMIFSRREYARACARW